MCVYKYSVFIHTAFLNIRGVNHISMDPDILTYMDP